ncbi:hypothetical protein THAOC_28368 [Thalassiosira oceanica]|uniref:Uncharacterized protein n=1 Tax=Thalassiosira oceanica TaxID=159749 RepID=K0RGI7_THAOC|nr:hypothetical protein THAOC_28368 [Thalassiosira oceanica]|eukprot:EJK52365.1 hypothetical protein THAOC_28368 [Thalassiosira oceanica]
MPPAAADVATAIFSSTFPSPEEYAPRRSSLSSRPPIKSRVTSSLPSTACRAEEIWKSASDDPAGGIDDPAGGIRAETCRGCRAEGRDE